MRAAGVLSALMYWGIPQAIPKAAVGSQGKGTALATQRTLSSVHRFVYFAKRVRDGSWHSGEAGRALENLLRLS